MQACAGDLRLMQAGGAGRRLRPSGKAFGKSAFGGGERWESSSHTEVGGGGFILRLGRWLVRSLHLGRIGWTLGADRVGSGL